MHLTMLLLPLIAPLISALRSSGNGQLPENEPPAKRVAIIGAGAGGSSAAYHLSQFHTAYGIPISIDVFERSNYVGGRTTTVPAWELESKPIELGGSIFVEVNQILVSAARRFDLASIALENKDDDDRKPPGAPELGVWNGKEFVVTTKAENGWWEKARLLWKYGLAPIKTNRLMKETVGKFLNMYEEPLFPWEDLSEVVEKAGLTATTSHTGEQYLKASGIGDKFAKEIIQASTRVNYASNLGLIHGVETMVCMATDGAMAIKGGNWQIFSSMLKSSPSTISTHLNTTITTITRNTSNKTYTLTTSSGDTSTYDTVILAAPYQFADLEIDPPLKHTPAAIPYVQLHVTLFATPHVLSPQTFGLDPSDHVPQFVLTTLPDDENYGSNPDGVGSPGFFSISIVNTGHNPHAPSGGDDKPGRKEYIYKIFSPKPVTTKILGKLIGHPDVDIPTPEDEQGSIDIPDKSGPISWLYRKVWRSYPYEFPRVTFEDVKLDEEGLYYTSGIESFISTMETSALSGMNVARLVADRNLRLKKEEEEGEGVVRNEAVEIEYDAEGWVEQPELAQEPLGNEGEWELVEEQPEESGDQMELK